MGLLEVPTANRLPFEEIIATLSRHGMGINIVQPANGSNAGCNRGILGNC